MPSRQHKTEESNPQGDEALNPIRLPLTLTRVQDDFAHAFNRTAYLVFARISCSTRGGDIGSCVMRTPMAL